MQDFFRHVNEVRIIYHPFCFVFFNFKSILNQLLTTNKIAVTKFGNYVSLRLSAYCICNLLIDQPYNSEYNRSTRVFF